MRQALGLLTGDSGVPAPWLETGTNHLRAGWMLPSVCQLVCKSKIPPAFQRVTVSMAKCVSLFRAGRAALSGVPVT